MLFLNILLASLAFASAAVPSYIKPCATNDPKFNDCALQHARQSLKDVVKGDRKLGVPVLDPLEIVELKQENVPQNAIALTLNDLKVIGFKDADIQNVQFDFENNHAKLEFTVPSLITVGKYEVSGRLLVLPITGKGDLNSTAIEPKFTFEADLQDTVRGGKKYLQYHNPTIKKESKRVYWSLTNLFNGNELLGKEMNDFMDKNWKEVDDEVSPPVSQAIAEVVIAAINKLLLSATRDELFP